MKKLLLSIGGGILIGLLLSFLFWDYQGLQVEYLNHGGVDITAFEVDFDFVFFSFVLVIATAVFVHRIWNYVEQRKGGN